MKAWLLSLLVVAVAGVWTGGFLTAQEKGQKVVLKGRITCAKCDLEISKKCASVIVVKEEGKDVIYYFDTKSNDKYHAETCSEARQGEVTGVVSESDGKKIITVSELKYSK